MSRVSASGSSARTPAALGEQKRSLRNFAGLIGLLRAAEG